jgi:tetratricopeptide (TPR) repeat protein
MHAHRAVGLRGFFGAEINQLQRRVVLIPLVADHRLHHIALRRFGARDQLAEAVFLLDAWAKHPREPMIHYNLACYACQMGSIDEAKKYLAQAFKLAPGIRSLAFEDEDLQPLWDSL